MSPASRLSHAPTCTTSSRCLVLHRTVHTLWNLLRGWTPPHKRVCRYNCRGSSTNNPSHNGKTSPPPPEETENFKITIRNEQGNTNQNEELSTTEVNTTAQKIAAKIIGKGGDRVKKMKGIYGININTIQTGDNDRTFTIIGKPQNVEKVAKIIRDIAHDTQERDTERNE